MLKIAICEDDNMQRKNIVNMIETYLGAIGVDFCADTVFTATNCIRISRHTANRFL